MSKRLTLKQLKFIQIYIETGNATKAAMEVYRCKNENVAKSVGSENLTKPDIAFEIDKYRKKGGLSVQKAINAINDGYDAEKGAGQASVPDHNVRLRSADMTLKLANAYPSRAQEVHHKHAHLFLNMVKEFSKLPFDELTRMMEKEAGVAPGTDIDIHKLLLPEHEQ